MNDTIIVSRQQYRVIAMLAMVCSASSEVFDEDRWLRGVKSALGFLPPLCRTYQLVVVP